MSSLPPKSWYFAWVAMHVEATAGGNEATAALIAAKDVATDIWTATEEELWECTNRLLRTMRTPKFANEHVDAVGLELVALRSDRVKQSHPSPQSDSAFVCESCRGLGMIVVPHPLCVSQGKLVNFRLRDGTDYGRIQCIAVICDECPQGEAEMSAQHRRSQLATESEEWKRKKHMSLSTYRAAIDHADGIELLRKHTDKQAADARAVIGPMSLKNLPGIAGLLAGNFAIPRRERPRTPAQSFPTVSQ